MVDRAEIIFHTDNQVGVSEVHHRHGLDWCVLVTTMHSDMAIKLMGITKFKKKYFYLAELSSGTVPNGSLGSAHPPPSCKELKSNKLQGEG